jgi:hypothetical protein
MVDFFRSFESKAAMGSNTKTSSQSRDDLSSQVGQCPSIGLR